MARPAADTDCLLRSGLCLLAPPPPLRTQPGPLTFIWFPAPQMVPRGCASLECFYLLSKRHIFWCGFFMFSFVSLGQIERFGDSGFLRHLSLETKKKKKQTYSHYVHLTPDASMTFPFPTDSQSLSLPLIKKKTLHIRHDSKPSEHAQACHIGNLHEGED